MKYCNRNRSIGTFLVQNARVPGTNSKLCMGSRVVLSLNVEDDISQFFLTFPPKTHWTI